MHLIALNKYDLGKMRELASKIATLQGDEQDFKRIYLEFCVYAANGQASYFEDNPGKLIPSSSNVFYNAVYPVNLPMEKYLRMGYRYDRLNPEYQEYQGVYTSFAKGLLSNPSCPMSILLNDTVQRSPFWPVIAQNDILALWFTTDPDTLANVLLTWYMNPLINGRSLGFSYWSQLTVLDAVASKKDQEYPWSSPEYSDEWLLNWFDENLRLVGIDQRIPRPARTSRGISSKAIQQWLTNLGQIGQHGGREDLFYKTLRTLDRRSFGRGARGSKLSWGSYGGYFLKSLVERAGMRGLMVFLDRCRGIADHLQTPFPYHILSEIMDDYSKNVPEIKPDPKQIFVG